MSVDILPGGNGGSGGDDGDGGGPPRRPFRLEELLAGDWVSPATVAGPTVAVAFALGLVANLYLAFAGSNAGDFGLGHSAGGYLRSAISLVAMAFGSPTFASSSGSHNDESGAISAGMAPLTITLLTAVVFVLLLRRYGAAVDLRTRVVEGLRAAALTAVGLALLSIGMDTTLRSDGQSLHQSGSPGRILGWSVLLFGIIAIATVARASAYDDARPWARVWADWRLEVEGALAGIGTAIVVGGVTGLLIITAEANGSRLDVLKAMPMLLAYFVNLGVDVFTVGMGAGLHVGFGGGDGGSATLSLFDRHGLSSTYLLLFALPPIAIAAGIRWIRRRGAEGTPEHVARSSYRMALPAALLYLLLALPSRAGYTFGTGDVFGGSGHAGVQVLLGTALTAAWFLVLGYAATRLWPAQGAAGRSVLPPRPFGPAWLRGSLAAGPVAIVAGIVGVLCASAGAATATAGPHDADLGPLSGLLLFGAVGEGSSASGSSSGISVEPATPGPIVSAVPAPMPTAVGPDLAAVGAALRSYALAEETYFTQHQTYTEDRALLPAAPTLSPGEPAVFIARADDHSYCLQSFTSTGTPYRLDSTTGVVEAGTC